MAAGTLMQQSPQVGGVSSDSAGNWCSSSFSKQNKHAIHHFGTAAVSSSHLQLTQAAVTLLSNIDDLADDLADDLEANCSLVSSDSYRLVQAVFELYIAAVCVLQYVYLAGYRSFHY